MNPDRFQGHRAYPQQRRAPTPSIWNYLRQFVELCDTAVFSAGAQGSGTNIVFHVRPPSFDFTDSGS
jgi:hypothetical protein